MDILATMKRNLMTSNADVYLTISGTFNMVRTQWKLICPVAVCKMHRNLANKSHGDHFDFLPPHLAIPCPYVGRTMSFLPGQDLVLLSIHHDIFSLVLWKDRPIPFQIYWRQISTKRCQTYQSLGKCILPSSRLSLPNVP